MMMVMMMMKMIMSANLSPPRETFDTNQLICDMDNLKICKSLGLL